VLSAIVGSFMLCLFRNEPRRSFERIRAIRTDLTNDAVEKA
jgi:hypothetical protein